MKIFISFSNKDNTVLNSFVDHFLKLGLNISSDEIECTGIEDSKPKTGDDFKNWIKNNLKNSDIIILLISQNYKTSEVCLNEMGAAWILDKKVFPLLIEPINYNNVGFLNNTIQLLKIDNRDDLFTLKDDLNIFLENRKVSDSNFNKQVDKFLKEVKTVPIFQELLYESDDIGETFDYSFFNKLLMPDIDYRGLLLQSQPTLSDCKLLFGSDYYKIVYDYYSFDYRNMLEIQESINDLSEYNTFDVYSATYNDLKDNKHQMPGGMRILTEYNAIKKNVRFYSISFRRKDTKGGTTFTAWAYINNRWVLFAKPWKIIEFIAHAKYNKNLNSLIKFLKFFKVLRKLNSFEIQYLMNRVKE